MKLLLNLCLIALVSKFASATLVDPKAISKLTGNVEIGLDSLKRVIDESIDIENSTLVLHIDYVNEVHANLESSSQQDIFRHMALSINMMQYLSAVIRNQGFDFPECISQNYYKFGAIAQETSGKIHTCLDNYVVQASQRGKEFDGHLEIVHKLREEAVACNADQACLKEVAIKITDAILREPMHIYNTALNVKKHFDMLKSEMIDCNAIFIKELTLLHSLVMITLDNCIKAAIDKDLH